MQALTYDNFEKVKAPRPVYRLEYFEDYAKGKVLLDLGSYDETALNLKAYSDLWLFAILERNARKVTGIDMAVPGEKFDYKSATILNKNVYDLRGADFPDVQAITAGEILEHLDSPIEFMRHMKKEFPGRELVLSTPNGLNFSNTLMGMIRREVQHIDHIQFFSYKILNTLCKKAGFQEWEIIPYHFFANEMKLRSKSRIMKMIITIVEKCIHGVEFLFPVLSMGYIVRAKI